MTNEQSLKNIETVKSLIHLYSDNCVYLKFDAQNNFEIVLLEKLDDQYHSTILDHYYDKQLPYGHLWSPPLRNDPHLLYSDVNLCFMFNLTTQEYTIDYKDAPDDLEALRKEAREEYQKLTGKLK